MFSDFDCSDDDMIEEDEAEAVSFILKRPPDPKPLPKAPLDYLESILAVRQPNPHDLSVATTLSLDLSAKPSQKAMSTISAANSVEEMVAAIEQFDDKYETAEDYLSFELSMRKGRPHLKIAFDPDEEETPELTDSGCFPNLMDRGTYESIKAKSPVKLELQHCPHNLQSHTGHPIETIGSVQVPMYATDTSGVKRQFSTMTWVVTAESHRSIILGTRFMIVRGAKMAFDSASLDEPETFTGRLMFPKDTFNRPDTKPKPKSVGPRPSFRLHPVDRVTLYPKKVTPVHCHVIAENLEQENALKKSHVLVKCSDFEPEGLEEVVAYIDENLKTSITLKNHDSRVGVTLDHNFCVGTGTAFGEGGDEIVAEVSTAVQALVASHEIDTFQYNSCACQIKNPKVVPVIFCDQGGSSCTPFFGLNEHFSPSPLVRHFRIQETNVGHRLFVREGRVTKEIAKTILDKLPKDVQLVAVTSKDFTLSECSTMLKLRAECMRRKVVFQAGIFKRCDHHQDLELKPRKRTAIYFGFEDTRLNMKPFVTPLRFESIAEVKGYNDFLFRNTKNNTNLLWAKLPFHLRMKEDGCRSFVRQVLHAIHLTDPNTLLTVFVDPGYSSHALQAALEKETSLCRLRIQPYEEAKVDLDKDQVQIGGDLDCIFQVPNCVSVINSLDSPLEPYAVQIQSLLDVAEKLPNPETKKGLSEAIKRGQRHEESEEFLNYLQSQNRDTGEENFPKEARDDQSEVSAHTTHKFEAQLPEAGPEAKMKRPKSWRELDKTCFTEETTDEQREFYSSLFDRYDDCIQKCKGHIRPINCAPLDIKLTSNHSLRKAFPMSPKNRDILIRMLMQMCEEGFLTREVTTRFCSPCFLVARGSHIHDMPPEERDKLIKENPRQAYRIVVDLSRVNLLFETSSNEMASADTIIDSLQGHKLYATADLAELFHCLPVSDQLSEAMTLIAPPNLLFRPNFAIEGLSKIPIFASQVVTFHIRKKCYDNSISYMDDLALFGDSVEEIRQVMTSFFEDLEASNALVSLHKLVLETTKFNYLGISFSVDEYGILTYLPLTQRYKIFGDIQITNLGSLMKYLGCIAFVSSWCGSLATLCSPLYAILAELAGKPKTTPIQFTDVQRQAFEALNARLINLERLTVPGVERDLILAVDAGLVAYGSCLIVKIKGEYRIAAFHSRRFPDSFVRSNSSMSKEAYGVMNSVLRHASRIMAADSVTVWCDCRVFVYLASNGLPAGSLIPMRWLSVLSSFDNITYQFVPRDQLSGPDYLGRLQYEYKQPLVTTKHCEYHYKKLHNCQMKPGLLEPGKTYTMKDMQDIGREAGDVIDPSHKECVECLPPKVDDDDPPMEMQDREVTQAIASLENVPRIFPVCSIMHASNSSSTALTSSAEDNSQFSITEIIKYQQASPNVRQLILILQTTDPPPPEYRKWALIHGTVLAKKKHRDAKRREDMQIYVPKPLITRMLFELHRLSHPSAQRLINLMRPYFYHEEMQKIATNLIQACQHCILFKTKTFPNLPLGMLRPATKVLGQLFIDFMYLPPARHRGVTYRYCLTVVDQFSFFGIAYAVPDMTTETFLDKMNELLGHGLKPDLICADNQVSLLKNKKAQDYFDERGIDWRTTMAYSSRSNLAEIYNKLIRTMLRLVTKDRPKSWPSKLNLATALLNQCPHHSWNPKLNGITPQEIVFNRKPDWSPTDELKDPALSVEVRQNLHDLIHYLQDSKFRVNQSMIKERMLTNRIQKGSIVVIKKSEKERKSKQDAYYHSRPCRVVKVSHQHGLEVSPRDEPQVIWKLHISKVKPYGVLDNDIFQQLTEEQRAEFPNVMEGSEDSESEIGIDDQADNPALDSDAPAPAPAPNDANGDVAGSEEIRPTTPPMDSPAAAPNPTIVTPPQNVSMTNPLPSTSQKSKKNKSAWKKLTGWLSDFKKTLVFSSKSENGPSPPTSRPPSSQGSLIIRNPPAAAAAAPFAAAPEPMPTLETPDQEIKDNHQPTGPPSSSGSSSVFHGFNPQDYGLPDNVRDEPTQSSGSEATPSFVTTPPQGRPRRTTTRWNYKKANKFGFG